MTTRTAVKVSPTMRLLALLVALAAAASLTVAVSPGEALAEPTNEGPTNEGPTPEGSFTITWKDDDGEVIDTTEVAYGDTPAHANPAKPSDAQYTYTFAGWEPAIGPVTGPATYMAIYTAEPRKYAITWMRDDGKVIDTTTVEYGQTPTPPDPAKPSDEQYDYTFAGWSPKIAEVTGEATYTAKYTAKTREYTITWKRDDETVIGTTTVAYGDTPKHDDPAKDPDAQYTYTFSGWEPAIGPVTGDAEYTAKYTAETREYTITWRLDQYLVDTTTVEYGKMPMHEDPPRNPYLSGDYVFAGWSPEIARVTGDAEYTATYRNKFTITWKRDDGTVFDTTEVVGGETPEHAGPTKPSDARYDYTFAGWEPEPVKATGDATYTAVFTATQNKGKPEYRVASAPGSAWVQGSSNALTITFERDENDETAFDHFAGIMVDGAFVPAQDGSGRTNYTARKGSVIVELQPSYLATLSPGTHTVTALFDDGDPVDAEFTVSKPRAKPAGATGRSSSGTSGTTARTGDSIPPAAPAAVAALAASSLALAASWRRMRG